MAITNNHIFFSNTNTSDDPLNYPSITCINKHMTNSDLSFTFQPATKKSD